VKILHWRHRLQTYSAKEYRGCMVANLFGPDLGIVVIVIVVVLLAGSQLPKIARNVGTAGREFRKAERDRQAQAARGSAGAIPAAPPVSAAGQPGGTVANAGGSANGVAPASGNEESISLTPAQLEALLKAREDQVRRSTGSDN
jgi:hypothetical protein